MDKLVVLGKHTPSNQPNSRPERACTRARGRCISCTRVLSLSLSSTVVDVSSCSYSMDTYSVYRAQTDESDPSRLMQCCGLGQPKRRVEALETSISTRYYHRSSICPSVHLSVRPSVRVYPSVRPSVRSLPREGLIRTVQERVLGRRDRNVPVTWGT